MVSPKSCRLETNPQGLHPFFFGTTTNSGTNKYHFTSNILCSFILCWSWMLLFSYQFISIKCNYNSCVCFISASKKQPVLIALHACTKPSSKSFPVFPLCNVVCFCIYFSVVCSVHSCFWRCVCVWFFFPLPSFYIFWRKKKKLWLIMHLTYQTFIRVNAFLCVHFSFQTTFSSFVQ